MQIKLLQIKGKSTTFYKRLASGKISFVQIPVQTIAMKIEFRIHFINPLTGKLGSAAVP
jgi:hypothetical protein